MQFRAFVGKLAVAFGMTLAAAAQAADFETNVETIRQVGRGAAGSRAAAAAWRELSAQGPDRLVPILRAMESEDRPLAANYFRSAFETIAERTLEEKKELPAADLEAFVRDVEGDPRARRLAFEWLERVDPTARPRLIPGMLNDPSVELRRDAVQILLDKAQAALKDENRRKEAAELFTQAFTAARDQDQMTASLEALKTLGLELDAARQLGFILDWRVIGPFDNTGGKGFAVAYPPETKVELREKYPGKEEEVGWFEFESTDEIGVVDLAKDWLPHKGAVAYAVTEFTSDRDQAVELRLGTPNAFKVWVNGEFVFGRDEYHRGTSMDQYRLKARLRKGSNQILLKICQNEQTEEWAQAWSFQFRVCDRVGTAILSTTRPPRSKPAAKTPPAA